MRTDDDLDLPADNGWLRRTYLNVEIPAPGWAKGTAAIPLDRSSSFRTWWLKLFHRNRRGERSVSLVCRLENRWEHGLYNLRPIRTRRELVALVESLSYQKEKATEDTEHTEKEGPEPKPL